MKEVGSENKLQDTEKNQEIKSPQNETSDMPKIPLNGDNEINPFKGSGTVFDKIFKSFGLLSEDTSSETSNDETTESKTDYSDFLEKGEDGKYYDKETGKSYETVEDWKKEQNTLAKKYLSTADYYENKAKKEWAKYKNADENGESEEEKWKHYQKAQEYYAKAKECREKGNKILEKLNGSNENSVNTSDSIDEANSETNENLESKPTRDLTEDEKDYLRDTLGWTDKQIEKCTIDEDGKIHYKTDREDLEGKTAENGVRYERKTVEINGVKIEGVFPVFESTYEVQLPKELEKSSNPKQFRECNNQLKEAVDNDPDLKEKFSDEQLEDIETGRTPEGYVWHHNEETGKMQLVKVEDHDRTQGGAAHTGGKSLWGGGYNTDATNNSETIKSE